MAQPTNIREAIKVLIASLEKTGDGVSSMGVGPNTKATARNAIRNFAQGQASIAKPLKGILDTFPE
jgi:hypothetical protein